MYRDEDLELVRRYLLRDLREDEVRQVEERMMVEADYYNFGLQVEDELVEQYVRGQLSRKDRRKFEAVFLTTDAGRREIEFNRAFYRRIKSITEERKPSRRLFTLGLPPAAFGVVLKGAATAAVILLVTALVWWLRDGKVTQGRSALIALFSKERPTHSRISGFPYARFIELMGGDGTGARERAEREGVSSLVREAVRDEPEDSDALHLLGQYYLSVGDFDGAIAQLRKASELDPKNAPILSDLGAALYEKARRQGVSSANDPILEEGIEGLNRAISLEPGRAEPYFNRALWHQLMKEWDSAKADWQRYLELDSTSPWADEARKGLQQIEDQEQTSAWDEQRLFEDFMRAAASRDERSATTALFIGAGIGSSFIPDRLIGELLDPKAVGGHDYIALLAWAGQLARKETGDPFWGDIAEQYARTPGTKLDQLRDGRREFVEASTLLRRNGDAVEKFKTAAQKLEELGHTAEALQARYREAQGYLRRPQLDKARKLLDEIGPVARARGYRWLESRVHAGLAELYFTRSEYSRAIDYAQKSLGESRELSNAAGVGWSCTQLSEIYTQLGDYDEAGSFAWEGLQAVNSRPVQPSDRQLPYAAAADLFTASRKYSLAIAFNRECLQLAYRSGAAVQISYGHAHLGRAYGMMSDYEQAIHHIDKAREAAAELPDLERADALAFAFYCAADLYRRKGELDSAVLNYDEVVNNYARSKRHNEAFAARMGKLLCHIKRVDLNEAGEQLASISGSLEQFAREIRDEKGRILFTESQDEFYDAAVSFAHSTEPETKRAYEYAERFRARTLFDLTEGPFAVKAEGRVEIGSHRSQLTADEIVAQLADAVQLVQYAVLKDRLLAWVVSGGEVRAGEKLISQEEVDRLVSRFVAVCGRHDAVDARPESTALYQILIEPIEHLLDPGKQLCIIPDKQLSKVAFPALISPRTGRYLIQDYALSSASSSSLFVKCSGWAAKKAAHTPERVLSVGDPHFDQGRYGLSRLPATGRAAMQVADLYSLRIPLIGPQATERAVVGAMKQAEVVNFFTHYRVDNRSPMLSELLLSSEGTGSEGQDSDGALHGDELYGLKLPRARIVVLAGCETLGEQFYKFEGAIGAARPFISAGVPLVVASLWRVDSEATVELIVEFHKQRKLGNSSAEALRQSQIKMIESGDYRSAPFYWAAFSLVGGYAKF
jgi:CHAT domain-containing protein/Tfp pilus assembly protein PilF